MLYLIATPIGNLKDMTYRAIETLKSCDLVLCEDTRVSQKLFSRYQIDVPKSSYHKMNEKIKLPSILKQLKEGKTIGLISDAGTPGVSDPGHLLIQTCIEHSLPFTALPGACSLIQAFVLSGLPSPFQFLGFLSKKPKKDLLKALIYPGTTIFFESPHRILKTLKLVAEIAPDREIVIARELTKKFEETYKGPAKKIFESLQKKSIKGEIVLLIGPGSLEFVDVSFDTWVSYLQKYGGFNIKDSIKLSKRLLKK